MSLLELRTTGEATSAAGAMLKRQVREPMVVGMMLAGLGTSTASALSPEVAAQLSRATDQTTAGGTVSFTAPAGAAIAELRRLSGLTWQQLARLFNVSRRSLHFWASGKPMAASNEEHLQRLLAVVRKIDRGFASANRTMLLGGREDGSLPVDLLADGEYDRVLSLIGPGETPRPSPPKPSKEALARRAPPAPHELVGALHDPIHRDEGAGRAAKSVRVRGGGGQ